MWMIRKITTVFLNIIFPSTCYVCKKEGGALCTVCLRERDPSCNTPAPVITSFYSFKDPVIKKIIHAIKYFHRKDLIAPLVESMSQEITITHRNKPLLIPIPMPTLRKYIRGYNHGEAIARAISKQANIPVDCTSLARRKKQKRQVLTHSRAERLKNQQGVFYVTGDISGMNIILVDDVTTTGATLLEARKVLLEKGASSVECFTIAH